MKHLVSKTAYTEKRITITFANVSKDTIPVAKVYVEKQYLGATILTDQSRPSPGTHVTDTTAVSINETQAGVKEH